MPSAWFMSNSRQVGPVQRGNGIDARHGEDLSHRGGGDRVLEAGRPALDPSVSASRSHERAGGSVS